MLFNFTLTPLEQIQPWGQRQCWFGLTDGQYWIEAGSEALLEYADHVRNKPMHTKHCNFEVARLYEDLLQILPHVLDPVPPELIPYFSGDTGKVWDKLSASWFSSCCEGAPDEDEFWEIAEISATWIGSRVLDTLYLRPSSNIKMWSDESTVFIEWDNSDKLIDNKCAWTAINGMYRLPRKIFIEEVRLFYRTLMGQMEERVNRVLDGALPNDIQVDVIGLKREHMERSQKIESALAELKCSTNWKPILNSIHKIEQGAYLK